MRIVNAIGYSSEKEKPRNTEEDEGNARNKRFQEEVLL
jgi:hypothetical protein